MAIIATAADDFSFPDEANIDNNTIDDAYLMLDEIGPSELKEYRDMLLNLGFYPDKVQINTLTMIAEDYAPLGKSASDLYNLIRDMLISPKIAAGRKLPLIYVIDSILKNAKGQYIPLIEKTASEWIDVAYKLMEHREDERGKLRKVVNTWRDFAIFQPESLAQMSQVFEEADAAAKAKADTDNALLHVTPIVRKQMQLLLNSLHEGMDELHKISLERLAQINPKLLLEIRQEAMDMVARGADVDTTAAISAAKTGTSSFVGNSVFAETRSPQEIDRSAEWAKIDYFNLNQGKELMSSLMNLVLEGAIMVAPPNSKRTDECFVDLLVAASAASKCLSVMMQNTLNNSQTGAASKKKQTGVASQQQQLYPLFLRTAAGFSGRSDAQRYVNKDVFTNDGIKERNPWVIESLYDQGLPFVSSSDGRRFASQLEISKHIDALFRKSQSGKVMERTEERCWYQHERDWSGSLQPNVVAAGDSTTLATRTSVDNSISSSHGMLMADESRSKCSVCGLLFKMLFDNDHGEWMYKDCHEIEVLNDDAAEKESDLMLVHFTCWRKIGSPDQLTKDQIL